MSREDGGVGPHVMDVHGSHHDVWGGEVDHSLAAAMGFNPWGLPSGQPDQHVFFGYRGEVHTSDLVHLRNREYDPLTGTFTSPDPLDGVDGTTTVANPYHYADNDPLNKVDPLGLRPTDEGYGGARTTERSFSVPRISGGGRVRIGQFIMESVVSQLGVELGTGDGRGFNPHMVDRDNRVYLEVDFDAGRGRLFCNYSCEPDGVTCYDAPSPDSTSSIRQYPGGVTVSYTVGNSVVEAHRERCNSRGLNCTVFEVGSLFKISAEFTILSNGWGVCVMGRHSRFPSTELYFDSGTRTHTIRQYEQIPGAVLGLGAPDSRFGCEIADLPVLGHPKDGGGQVV